MRVLPVFHFTSLMHDPGLILTKCQFLNHSPVSHHGLGSNPGLGMEEVASDLGLGGGFRRVLRFPPLLTTG